MVSSNWARLLPFAEMSYNNSIQQSTKMSPFFINYGFHPAINLIDSTCSNPSSYSHFSALLTLQPILQENLHDASKNTKHYADLRRGKNPTFNIGDKVLLSTKNLKFSLPTRKFTARYTGPFEIIDIINPVAFRLKLPDSWKIHPVFHASLLKKYTARHNTPEEMPTVPIPDDSYEVNAIIDSKIKNKKVYYLFDWKGYSVNERTWQMLENFEELRPLLNDFHAQFPLKPRDERV